MYSQKFFNTVMVNRLNCFYTVMVNQCIAPLLLDYALADPDLAGRGKAAYEHIF